MNEYWLLLLAIPTIVALIFLARRIKPKNESSKITEPSAIPELPQKEADFTRIFSQLSALEERTKQLQGIEEKIEKIRDKQDSQSNDLRDKLYNEYSKRLQESIELLKETYSKMSTSTSSTFKEISDRNAEVSKQINSATSSAFREITEIQRQTGQSTLNTLKEISGKTVDVFQQTAAQINANTRELTNRNIEVYKATTFQLNTMIGKLESAFKILEERDHASMREEIESLKQKILELERDPLKVQLAELGEARVAQAVHEQSVRKICTLFWSSSGEIRFNEKIGQYVPDVLISNHRIRLVADEVTTSDPVSIREKVRRVVAYMEGTHSNIGYVIIPNAGLDSETLRELKATAPHGLYIARISEFAVHLRVWHELTINGLIDLGSLVEKGQSFLTILEPIFEQFMAIVQNLEQREEKEATYRFNRYKELKMFPSKVFDAIEKTQTETK